MLALGRALTHQRPQQLFEMFHSPKDKTVWPSEAKHSGCGALRQELCTKIDGQVCGYGATSLP